MKRTFYIFILFLLSRPFLAQTKIDTGQELDSIIDIKPFRSIVKDTTIQGVSCNRIDFNAKSNIIAAGGLTKNQIKTGRWIYFDSTGLKPLCIGAFKKGLKNGKWFQYWNLCAIKYKSDKEVKRRYKF